MNSTAGNLPLRMRAPLRFVHASDLHLDRTLERVSEGPMHWEQRMLDVSRRAAERLFQKVIEENVDFLVLSGDVLNAALAPPGTFLFLLDQFERLKRAGITVYWAGGEFDSPEDWPTAFPLPDNVHHFPGDTIQEYYFQRSEGGVGTPLAKIVGMSRNQRRWSIRSSEFPIDPGGLYTIAVANGLVDPESLAQRRIDYWALGGDSQRQVFHGNPRKKGPDGKPIPLDPPTEGVKRDIRDLPPLPYTVHYPGATVARTPKDIGRYGATLVEVPWGEEPIMTYFSTSPVRWVNDQITLDATADGGQLADELRVRIKNFRDAQKSDDLLINWFVDVPPGPLAASLRRGSLTADLLNELRTLYGNDDPMTWSVSLSLLLPDRLPKSYYDQQTILGDFLRSVRHFQDQPGEILDLEPYLPKDWGPETLVDNLLLARKVEAEITGKKNGAEAVEEPSEDKPKYHYILSTEQSENRHRVLQEAALVGLELLGAETPKLFTYDNSPPRTDDEEQQNDNDI